MYSTYFHQEIKYLTFFLQFLASFSVHLPTSHFCFRQIAKSTVLVSNVTECETYLCRNCVIYCSTAHFTRKCVGLPKLNTPTHPHIHIKISLTLKSFVITLQVRGYGMEVDFSGRGFNN